MLTAKKNVLEQKMAGKPQRKIQGPCIDVIKRRQSEEIVIACCGALGSGTSEVASKIKDMLESYNYTVKIIKASDFIIDNSGVSRESLDGKAKHERVALLQQHGNKLREDHSNDIIAQYIIQDISTERKLYYEQHKLDATGTRRYATIVDSLKHPMEVELFTAVYRDMFYLFGVLCPEKLRLERLTRSGFRDKAQDLIDKDKSESIQHGQHLLDTIHLSDFFISNIHENADKLDEPVKRFVELLLGNKVYTPTKQEFAMFVARAAALKSACMSRQVGAAVVNADGDILSTGRNDVPKFGGGIYSCEDKAEGNDGRCMYRSGRQCSSDLKKGELQAEIRDILFKKLTKKTKANEALVKDIVSSISKIPKLKGLIEFTRAVHAEMDAITTAARLGGISLKGAEMFVTTFPCHHCARHIVSSGIKTVVYIEPYEKSLAPILHDDSIAVEVKNGTVPNKLLITPFEGVSPKRYLQFFHADNRKELGKAREYNCKTSLPVCEKQLDTHFEYEKVVIDFLTKGDNSDPAA